MKVGEMLRQNSVWRELFGFVEDLYDSAQQCRDGELMFIAQRLVRIVTRLAKSEVETGKLGVEGDVGEGDACQA